MKKITLIVACMIAGIFTAGAQGLGINTDGSNADASAVLDLKSSNQGILIPRMKQSERVLIAAPATGLMVYQTDGTPGFYFYNGTVWTSLNGTNGSDGQGVPAGGTANQVLSKIDGTNYNTQWVTPAGADNLGNHTATATLNMNSNAISNATNVTATGTATLGGNTYPTSTGTNGQVLTTNGAGALSWGSAGGATLMLKATATGTAQTMTVGSSLSLPGVVSFNTTVGTNAGNVNWTLNNKYTVPSGGAGLYLISVQIISDQTYATPMLDINIPGETVPSNGEAGTDFYGTGLLNSTAFQNPHKGRGQLQTTVYLNAGESFQIRGASGSTVTGAQLSTDGSTNITVVKLN